MTDHATDPEYGPVFGVLTPQANTSVEPEMQSLLQPGTVLSARCTSRSADARQRLIDYADGLAETLAQFDTAPLRVAGFACTGSSYLMGRMAEDKLTERLSAGTGAPVITAAQAIRQALDALGVRRLAVLSPYPAWLTTDALDYWQAAGYAIGALADMPLAGPDTRGIYDLTTARVQAALSGLNSQGCDAVLLSGTGMPSLRAIATSESTLPMLSSNLCLAWVMRAVVEPEIGTAEGLRRWLSPQAGWRSRLIGLNR